MSAAAARRRPEVRHATPDDLPRLIELNRFVQDLHADAHPDVFRPSDDLPGVDDFFEGLLSDSDQLVLVATVEGRIVGFLCAEVQRRAAHTFVLEVLRLYVHQVAVEPGYRRGGAGRALFAELERLARAEGIDDIALDTWHFNGEARDFFVALGFRTYNVRMWKRPDPVGSGGGGGRHDFFARRSVRIAGVVFAAALILLLLGLMFPSSYWRF